MSDLNPLDPMVARNRLAAIHRGPIPPDPEADTAARTSLATAKCDKAIRGALSVSPPLSDAQIGHLVGLILNYSGIDGETSTDVEKLVRTAVVASRGPKGDA